MSDKQKIRAEVERRIKSLESNIGYGIGVDSQIDAYESLLSFIDTLPENAPNSVRLEEPVSKDFDKFAEEYFNDNEDDMISVYDRYAGLVDGASWKQQQLITDAVDGVVHCFGDDEIAAVHYNDPKGVPMSYFVSSKGLKAGDRVKVIIIKED